MGYTNSPMVVYTKLSPNHSGLRTHSIDRISPHCVVGQLSIETLGGLFARSSYEASSNYGIGSDGRVGMYVEEKNRSWCTSSNENDQRAVTIECASDTKHPYTMNSKVYNTLINLCVDICKRNGKDTLIWFGDKNKSFSYKPKSNEMIITVHRWTSNKSCPGDWLYNRLGDVAKKVTEKLQKTTSTTQKEEAKEESVKTETKSEDKDNETIIWEFLKGKGLNDYAVAGLMGNLKAESNLRPDNLQNSFERRLGYGDESYTKAVDSGKYKNFVHDSAGYGLAQWTWYSRKENLLNYAKSVGKSIGDLKMQLEFLWQELQRYTSVMNVLNSAKSISSASDAVLTGFEKPANQGSSVKSYRSSLGKEIYDRHVTSSKTKNETKVSKPYIVQAGAFASLANAEKRLNAVNAKGYTATIVKTPNLYKIQIAYAEKEDAESAVKHLNNSGIKSVLIYG